MFINGLLKNATSAIVYTSISYILYINNVNLTSLSINFFLIFKIAHIVIVEVFNSPALISSKI
jgi:hypothetical protein